MTADNATPEGSEQPIPAGSRRTSRRHPGFCCGCLVATVALGIVFILVMMMLFSSPDEIVARAGRSRGDTDTVEQASSQWTEAQMRLARGLRPTVQIQLSDADVNAYIEEHGEELDLPSGFQAPKVAFGEGYIEGSVRTRLGFVPVRVRVNIVPEVTDGQWVVHVAKIKAGKMRLPESFRKEMANTLNNMIQHKLEQAGVEIKNVKVSAGLLTITAVLEPSDPPEDTF